MLGGVGKENAAAAAVSSGSGKGGAAAAPGVVKPQQQPAPAAVLPVLRLDCSCTLDFGPVALGQSKAVPFAIAAGGRLEIDGPTASNAVQVTLGPRSGIVMWTPHRPGPLREAIDLVDPDSGRRARLVVQGQAVGTAVVAVPAAPAVEAARQPLRPAAGINPNTSRSSLQTRLEASATKPSTAPTPRGGAAWDIGVEAFTPARKRPQPPLATPRRELRFVGGRPPSTAAKAAGKSGSSSSSSSGGAHAVSAPSARQEKVLCEWLNHTLLPPGPAEALPHPAQFLQMQDDETRARVQAMYASVDFERLRQAIRKEIDRKRLQLRDDRDLFADLSLREAFLELLQCYQLPWLQLGLEVVCGVEVDKARHATGRDGQLVRLSTLSALRGVVAQRVLADPDISRRYGAAGPRLVHGRAREAMLQDLRGHLLERFLCLVALLDHCKHLEVLPGRRRPLFRAAAAHKSSAALLHEFAKLVMAGEGDLAKHLRTMGYGVGVQQTFLEEFDFRVRASQLSQDLRDGVRLCRLVDALEPTTSSPALCDQLRVPAVSRLQKVHNLKLALTALQRAGLRLPGRPLTPDDLIDGHRDKAAALLWAIARHYDQEELLASLPGVTRLQALARGRIIRRRFLRLRGLALALQRLVRAHQVLLHCRRFPLPAALALQAHWRGRCARRAVAVLREAHAHAQAVAQTAAATALQAHARGLLARRRLAALSRAALKAQRLYRGHLARQQRRRRQVQEAHAALAIQAAWRAKRVRALVARWRAAAVVLQAGLRRQRAQQRFRRLRASAVRIQAAWRGKRARAARVTAVRAVVQMQARVRGMRARAAAQQQWRALRVLQRAARGFVAQRWAQRTEAAVAVQAAWRGYAVRRQLRQQTLAAIRLQAAWRMAAARARYIGVRSEQARARFAGLVTAALTVQRLWRGHRARARYSKQRQAVLLLQTFWRAAAQRRRYQQQRAAALRVQAATRRWAAVRRYQRCLRGVRALQRHARWRRLQQALQARKAAVVRAQSLWRGHRVRLQLARERAAAACIQTWAREALGRVRVRRFHRAVSRIQACLRGWRVRRVQGLKLRMLRARVAEANARAAADPSLRIGARHEAALEVLLTSKSCAHILHCCKTLELSTGLARECCEALVGVDGIPKLLTVVRSCNRSKPHITLLQHILRILKHVASHPYLLQVLAEPPGAVETLSDLLQHYRPEDHTFVPAAALLLTVCRAAAEARAELRQPAVLRKLQGSLRLLERKAEVEMKGFKYGVAGPRGKGKQEPTVAAPIRALRRVLELVEE